MTEVELAQTLRAIHEQVDALDEEQILNGPAAASAAPFAQLDRLAALPVPDDVVQRLLVDSGLAPVWPSIFRLRRVYNLRLELEQARSLLDANDPWQRLQGFHFWQNYRDLARMEVDGAGLAAGDRVVFLGAGPLPLSLVVLFRHHGVRGVGIERDPALAELAVQVVRHLGITEGVSIYTGDQRLLPLDDPVHLTMVAAAAEPRNQVFAHLVETLTPGSLLSYRICAKGGRRLLDPGTVFELPPELVEIHRVEPKPPVNNTVIMIRRR